MFTFNLQFPGQYFDAETGKRYDYLRDLSSRSVHEQSVRFQ
jgi:hypothetical protein